MKNPRPFFSLIRVAYTGLAIATLVPPIASCTHSNPAPIQAVDSAPMTGEGDAATFASEVSQAEVPRDGSWTEVGELACGDAICGPAQICLYPAYGCIGLVVPDSGICPEGTGFSSTNGRICIQTTPPKSFLYRPACHWIVRLLRAGYRQPLSNRQPAHPGNVQPYLSASLHLTTAGIGKPLT